MKIITEKIKEDLARDSYWLRIYFSSDDGSQKTTLLVCASRQYLWDFFGAFKPEEVDMKAWLDGVVKKWESLGEIIFNNKIQYDVYVNTLEGKKNALKFLKEEIIP
jgi:hypothetical protein